MSRSSASMAGPSVATAVPPQIAVLADRRLDSFQFTPNSRPSIYPPPKAVSSVKHIITSAYLPTWSTWEKLSVMPIRMMPAFSTFFETNSMPALACGTLRNTGFRIIPSTSAKTLAERISPGSIRLIHMEKLPIRSAEMRPAPYFR